MKEISEYELKRIARKTTGCDTHCARVYECDQIRCPYPDCVKAGIDLAQQWHKVEDELPENQDIVLLKTDEGCYSTGYIYSVDDREFITYGDEAYSYFGEVTHWRYIELKHNEL